MVSARTYPLWQELATAEELPAEALTTVIEALCEPHRDRYGTDMGRFEDWRKKSLAAALPSLLARTTDAALRGRLLEQTGDKMLAELAESGAVTAADLPTLLHTHKAQPGLVIGLARHPGQLEAAIGLLPLLHSTDLETVVREWDPSRYRLDDTPPKAVPKPLLDAVLENALAPLAAALRGADSEQEGWTLYSRVSLGIGGHDFDGPEWRILSACTERWPELVAHPGFGPAVQHLLLDQAETTAHSERMIASGGSYLSGMDPESEPDVPAPPEPALSEDLLRACLPALCLPELADLPKPSVSQLNRLHHIANRVRANPRLAGLAAAPLAEAADECVRRGRLLTASRNDDRQSHIVTVAEDLALIGAMPKQLAKACALLTTMEQPTVVATPPSERLARISGGIDFNTPVRLLESHYQHQRVRALTALARNPHTPRDAILEALQALHPVELVWILHQADLPEWLRQAVTALAPDGTDADDGVLRLMTDEELDTCPDPAAVLQSWLDAPESDGFWSCDDVHRQILNSRHRTAAHLRQLPADEVLTRRPGIALQALLDECGTDPAHWAALLPALTFDHSDKRTFGELLDDVTAPTGAA
ncbi:hypothetical protein AB0H77_31140 [Streptomyces sp. NPDC050844]|uniref:hypothetical protein n=1 Tax=Streptomyces sp. NPDC050844 TaxID=3155790 RepID=UPI0033E8A223